MLGQSRLKKKNYETLWDDWKKSQAPFLHQFSSKTPAAPMVQGSPSELSPCLHLCLPLGVPYPILTPTNGNRNASLVKKSQHR